MDGGAFNYGAHVAARMGLRVAAITRLAREDWRVVEALAALGVDVFAEATPTSTCLRLEYPSSNPDERIIYVTSTAGSFTPAQVAEIQAQAFVLGPSFRGEVGLDVIQALAAKGAQHRRRCPGLGPGCPRRQAGLRGLARGAPVPGPGGHPQDRCGRSRKADRRSGHPSGGTAAGRAWDRARSC